MIPNFRTTRTSGPERDRQHAGCRGMTKRGGGEQIPSVEHAGSNAAAPQRPGGTKDWRSPAAKAAHLPDRNASDRPGGAKSSSLDILLVLVHRRGREHLGVLPEDAGVCVKNRPNGSVVGVL